jgi:class 3 adenylate cyclase
MQRLYEITDDVQHLVEKGRSALARREWPAAYRLLSEADPADLTPDELEGFATAAVAQGALEGWVAALERAHAGFVAAGDPARAAWTAHFLAVESGMRGDLVVAGGWRATADRLVADAPECSAHAFALQSDAFLMLNVGDVDGAIKTARRAAEAARRVGSRDVELQALHTEGWARTKRGEVREGMTLMDEAMVAAVSGQLGPWSACRIFCQTMTACQQLGDYRRAAEWLQSADRASAIQGFEFSADCRIHRAGLLRLRGSWARAEAEARVGSGGHPWGWHVGWGWCEIGEIHLRMGDLAGAEEAFAAAYEHGYPPHPGFAMLHLAQGKVQLASSDIEQAFRAAGGEDLPTRARLLDARVSVCLAAKDTMTARASADELARIASTFGATTFEASAACAEGRVRLAEADERGAAAAFRQGVEAFVALELPYEAATARSELAVALEALADRDGALLELRAARSTFAQLGAALDERRVAALLESFDEVRIPTSAVEKTFMFTDIERSTLLAEALGDTAWDELLQWHDRTLREAIQNAGGQEVKQEGDGFFAAFDEPTSAIRCAAAIQQRLSLNRKEHGFAPQVRIGLHAGSAMERDGDYNGLAVSAAARVMSLAAGGEIVATTGLVGVGEQASPPREVRLKGVSDPVSVVTVAWETGAMAQESE